MKMKRVITWVCGVGLMMTPSLTHARDPLPSIVSLDVCTDQYVLALADPKQILALSSESRQPYSHYREQAESLPQHSGQVESLVSINPEVILSTGMEGTPQKNMLARFGHAVTSIPRTLNPTDMLQYLDDVAQKIDQVDRANALRAQIEERLKTLDALPRLDENALYLSPGGTTGGDDTLVGRVLSVAGFQNTVSKQGVTSWMQMNVEQVVHFPPDVVVGSYFDAKVGYSDGWRFARHPAVARLMTDRPFVEIPSGLMICSNWLMVEAADHLRQAWEASNDITH